MKIVNLIQGTPEWYAHRATHFNASDAAAMLGVSPHKSRRELLDEKAVGLMKDVSDFMQKRVFDPGHEFEARARGIAEKEILGEDLYPCVGVEGRLSASFDGLTLLEDTAFEHKSLSEELLAIMSDDCDGKDLPEYHRIQMEQQCLLSGARRVLFMASKWNGDELVDKRECWYTPDHELRQRIIDGWKHFEIDLANHVPETAAPPAPVGRAPDQLPALHIELTGMVTASNLQQFRDHAIAVFHGISTDLQTDQDFADAEKTVKWCEDIETRLRAAKDYALSQTQSIDELFRAIDSITDEARTKRLQLDRLVKSRKEQIRAEILTKGLDAVVAHYQTINSTLGRHVIQMPAAIKAEMADAIKGKRTVTTLKDAVDGVVTSAKISASQRSEAIRANIAVLADASAGYDQLFPDAVALCATKSPEDLRNLIALRIAEQKQRDEAKQQEAERAAAVTALANAPAPAALASAPVSNNDIPVPLAQRAPASGTSVRVKLGEINALIAPLSITADGLASLGFRSVGTDRAAKLFAAEDVAPICRKLSERLANAANSSLKDAA